MQSQNACAYGYNNDQFELASSLIIFLDHGHSLKPEINRPNTHGKKMVQIGPGDSILHKGEVFMVERMDVYRSLPA